MFFFESSFNSKTNKKVLKIIFNLIIIIFKSSDCLLALTSSRKNNPLFQYNRMSQRWSILVDLVLNLIYWYNGLKHLPHNSEMFSNKIPKTHILLIFEMYLFIITFCHNSIIIILYIFCIYLLTIQQPFPYAKNYCSEQLQFMFHFSLFIGIFRIVIQKLSFLISVFPLFLVYCMIYVQLIFLL